MAKRPSDPNRSRPIDFILRSQGWEGYEPRRARAVRLDESDPEKNEEAKVLAAEARRLARL